MNDNKNYESREILKILPQLSNCDRLKIAEEALRLTQQEKHNLTSEEIKQQWSITAIEAVEDYKSDEELKVIGKKVGRGTPHPTR